MLRLIVVLLSAAFLTALLPAFAGADEITAADANASAYTIVVPDGSISLYRGLANRVAAFMQDATGLKKVTVKTDKKPVEGVEILIGSTNREDSAAVLATLGSEEWTVQVMPSGNIVVLGTDVYRTVHAADQLVAFGLTRTGSAVTVDASLCLRGTLPLSSYEMAGASPAHMIRSANIKSTAGINEQSSLAKIRGFQTITQLTGEYSLNRTRSRYDVAVGDLGVTCLHNGKLYFFFGDTFGGEGGNERLRSNVMAYTTDLDYTDGIIFDGYLTDASGTFAKPITNGSFGVSEQANVAKGYEYTKIPTGAISLNGAMYMSYMSVAWWSANDDWVCNYGGIMKSTDDGQTWEKLDAQWPGDSKFCQMAPAYNEADGYVYVTGIGGGRQSYARLMRVKAEDYENFDAYEYLTGYDADGNPVWTAGEEGLTSTFATVNAKVWEPCMFYNAYLGEWFITYKNASGMQFYTSKSPAGPYLKTAEIPYPHDIAGNYALFMHPALSRNDGEKMAMFMSYMYTVPEHGNNMWQVMLIEITMVKKE